LRVILVPVHRADDAHVRFGCHERHLVGVVEREVRERDACVLLHLRIIFGFKHIADVFFHDKVKGKLLHERFM
jgi:hypothetical protein